MKVSKNFEIMDYDKCFELVIGHEGGFTLDPDDPGNWTGGSKNSGQLKGTKYGISSKAYPNEDIAQMTLERAKEIYKRDYWNVAKCDELPAHLKYIHFDTSVNMGVGTAAKLLQGAASVKVDGIIGKVTIGAAKNVTRKDYGFERALYYMYLISKNTTLAKYSKGWANRLKFVVKK